MPLYDASSYAGDLFGWKSEIGARIQDALARRSVPVTAKLGAIVRKIESAVSLATLKRGLSDLMAYIRHEVPTPKASEHEAFFRSITEHRQKESIENYGAYIVTVQIRL